MDSFVDFPRSLLGYFEQVDGRFAAAAPETVPAAVDWACRADMHDTRAVLWDIYGTICGAIVGDLEQSLTDSAWLEPAGEALINEFGLAEPLSKLCPEQSPAAGLAELYLRRIAESHEQSRRRGIEYPEVVIEEIWQSILADCREAGYARQFDEPALHTGYRWAYFFDSALQQTYLYPGIAEALADLNRAGIVQGIISNAQFYTPLHLRRLLSRAYGKPDFQLSDVFTDELVLYSYQLGCSKPNNLAFETALAELAERHISAEQAVFVGNDMLNDVCSAQHNGFRAILFAADERQTNLRADERRCAGSRPGAIVTDARQITQLILD